MKSKEGEGSTDIHGNPSPRQLGGLPNGDNLGDIPGYNREDGFSARTIPGPRHFSRHTPSPIHRGKGPKAYRKPDERILEDICSRMSDNRYLDASNLEVNVTEGDVLITGTVGSRYEKRLAEDLSDTAYGVKNVENRLRVSNQKE